MQRSDRQMPQKRSRPSCWQLCRPCKNTSDSESYLPTESKNLARWSWLRKQLRRMPQQSKREATVGYWEIGKTRLWWAKRRRGALWNDDCKVFCVPDKQFGKSEAYWPRFKYEKLVFSVSFISGYYYGPDSFDDRPCFTQYGRFKANLLIDAIENGLNFINLKVKAFILLFSIISFISPTISMWLMETGQSALQLSKP